MDKFHASGYEGLTQSAANNRYGARLSHLRALDSSERDARPLGEFASRPSEQAPGFPNLIWLTLHAREDGTSRVLRQGPQLFCVRISFPLDSPQKTS